MEYKKLTSQNNLLSSMEIVAYPSKSQPVNSSVPISLHYGIIHLTSTLADSSLFQNVLTLPYNKTDEDI